jgi:hypothetical protein
MYKDLSEVRCTVFLGGPFCPPIRILLLTEFQALHGSKLSVASLLQRLNVDFAQKLGLPVRRRPTLKNYKLICSKGVHYSRPTLLLYPELSRLVIAFRIGTCFTTCVTTTQLSVKSACS